MFCTEVKDMHSRTANKLSTVGSYRVALSHNNEDLVWAQVLTCYHQCHRTQNDPERQRGTISYEQSHDRY